MQNGLRFRFLESHLLKKVLGLHLLKDREKMFVASHRHLLAGCKIGIFVWLKEEAN